MPRLRRLRHSVRRANGFCRPGNPARKIRDHFRHRLFQPLPVLHEHVRIPHDSWPRAGRGYRRETRAARPRCLGGHWRRRFALDWRQSHHSHAAPQCGHQSPDVQQQDLRPHQGAILAHFRNGQENEINSIRHRRPSVQSHCSRDWRRRQLSSLAPWTSFRRT